MLLDRGPRKAAAQFLNVSGDEKRLELLQRKVAVLAPSRKLNCRPEVGGAGASIADVCGEELDVASPRLGTGVKEKSRHRSGIACNREMGMGSGFEIRHEAMGIQAIRAYPEKDVLGYSRRYCNRRAPSSPPRHNQQVLTTRTDNTPTLLPFPSRSQLDFRHFWFLSQYAEGNWPRPCRIRNHPTSSTRSTRFHTDRSNVYGPGLPLFAAAITSSRSARVARKFSIKSVNGTWSRPCIHGPSTCAGSASVAQQRISTTSGHSPLTGTIAMTESVEHSYCQPGREAPT